MIMEIISILLGVILVNMAGGGKMSFLIDLPSLIIILVFTGPLLCRGGIWKDFARGWKLLKKSYTCRLSELRRTQDVVEMVQKQVGYAGILSMLLTVIHILRMLSRPSSLGPLCAVAILTLLYAVVIEMLLLPLQLEVKRRIIDYVEMDTEEENAPTADALDKTEDSEIRMEDVHT